MLAAVYEVEEPADFGEGERDQAPVNGWRLVGFGGIVVLV
jgi:hypothetical protein